MVARTTPAQQPAPQKQLTEADRLLEQCLANTQVRDQAAEKLLEQIIEKSGGKQQAINNWLRREGVARLERLLPEQLKPYAERLAERALLYFDRQKDIKEGVSTAQFLRIVLQAAELGLALDGRLCYAVNFKGQWQCIPSYLGLVAVARRNRLILDCDGDVVCEHDQFTFRRVGGGTEFYHERPTLGGNRGKVVGAYVRLFLPNGRTRYEVMDRQELDKVRAVSRAQRGPWSEWENEMYKKTVLRRALKYFQDDIGLSQALTVEEFDESAAEQPATPDPLPVGRTNLRAPTPAAEEMPDLEPDVQQEAFDALSARIGDCEKIAELAAVEQEIENQEGRLGMVAAGRLRFLAQARKDQLEAAT